MPFLNEVLVADGVTASGRIVWSKAVLDFITNDHVIDIAVNAGGTGYVVGESFDIVGGTAVSSFVARGVVTAEAGGVVSGVKVLSAGAYSALPGATGAATTNASAAGNDDLTVDLTTEVAKWATDRNDYVDGLTDFEWLATSSKASNPPTVGLETIFSAGNGAVDVITASGYDNGADFAGQPDASPIGGNRIMLAGQNPQIYVSVTDRRVNMICRDGNFVQHGGIGLFIPIVNVEANWPFPGIAHGNKVSVGAFTTAYSTDGNGGANAGICNPASRISVAPPYYYRDNLSTTWFNIALDAGAARAMMWPRRAGFQDYSFTYAPQVSGYTTNPQSTSTSENGIFKDNSSSSDNGWFEGAGSAADGYQGVAAVGTGTQASFVVESHIIANQTGDVQIIGIVDGFSNVHGVGLTAFEEIESFQSASRYIVFPDTNGSDLGQWVAMEII